MSKLLLFILLLVGIYYLRRLSTQDDRPPMPRENATKPVEGMHACARCGLVVPRSEGVEAGDDFFCSAEHAQLGRTTPRS